METIKKKISVGKAEINTPEEKVKELYDFNELAKRIEANLNGVISKFAKALELIVTEQKLFLKHHEVFVDESQKVFSEIKRILKNHDQRITKLTEINDNVDQTLTNVLFAIRQNEYLQAWYPAQSGYPEMKVVGTHPAQAKREI